ncbi:MAG: RluA family pseudouridine synthase [Clostridia bacterium]|nr:RluA family pseudouridine synthase [Clostridia bacterium]
MKKFTVNKNDADQRLDKFVTKTTRGLPGSLLYKFIRKKRIKVNGKRSDAAYRLSEGDEVELFIPDEFFGRDTAACEYSRSKATPDVVFEDENVILVNKKPGVLSHTGDGEGASPSEEAERSTLIFAIKAYLFGKGEYDPSSENSFAPALCNRIDRNTGGIVIAAKNAKTLRAVNEAIKRREIKKFYLCAVHGIPEKKEGRATAYLRKDETANKVTVRDDPFPGAKKIVTAYRVVAENRKDGLSLLEVELLTGRTHQIRAHLDHLGFPLVGEGKYGVNREDRDRGFRYQALYSYKTVFESHIPEIEYLCGRSFSIPADSRSIPFVSLFGTDTKKR